MVVVEPTRVSVTYWCWLRVSLALRVVLGLGSQRPRAGQHTRACQPSWLELLGHYAVAPLRGWESRYESRVTRYAWRLVYVGVVTGLVVLTVS